MEKYICLAKRIIIRCTRSQFSDTFKPEQQTGANNLSEVAQTWIQELNIT